MMGHVQAIDEDKMNDVEFLLENGEDAMSKESGLRQESWYMTMREEG